jgi:glycosyltransferase involved in cell wall biosynthesis
MSSSPLRAPVTLALIHPELSAGVAAWRAVYPTVELATQGHTVAWSWAGTEQAAQFTFWAELVVLVRSEWGVGNEHLARAYVDALHSEGRCVIYDTDDDLYSEASVARVRSTGDEELNSRSDAQLEAERQSRIHALGVCDAVTVSTEHLATVVRCFTDRPVIVVPNAIDLDRFQAAAQLQERDRPVTIGWAGGNRPDVDATQLAIAWSRVADRYPDIRFVVGGFPLKALLQSVPEDRLIHVPKLPLSVYPQVYGLIDIGCAPLNDEPFNHSKSPIKAMEYAAAGAAVCASPIVYNDLITPWEDGILCRTADEWDRALSVMVEDGEWRRNMASRLLDKVEREHSLATQVDQWPIAWAEIVADFRKRLLPSAVSTGGTRDT